MEEDIRSILTSLAGQLHPADHKFIEEFIAYGEYALALETLCDQMSERGAVPTRQTYEQLMSLLSRMSIDDRYVRIVPKPSNEIT